MKKKKKIFKKYKEKIGDIKDLILFVLVYGSVINYMLFAIFNVTFNWYGFPAYGILFFLIQEEFPELWWKLRRTISRP